MVAYAARDADPAGLGQPLETGRDVDAVAEDIPVLHHHVADIDTDAEPHATVFGELLIGLGEVALDLDRALHGGEDAAELGEHAVARGAADPPAVLSNECVGDGPMRRE